MEINLSQTSSKNKYTLKLGDSCRLHVTLFDFYVVSCLFLCLSLKNFIFVKSKFIIMRGGCCSFSELSSAKLEQESQV